MKPKLLPKWVPRGYWQKHTILPWYMGLIQSQAFKWGCTWPQTNVFISFVCWLYSLKLFGLYVHHNKLVYAILANYFQITVAYFNKGLVLVHVTYPSWVPYHLLHSWISPVGSQTESSHHCQCCLCAWWREKDLGGLEMATRCLFWKWHLQPQ